MKQFLAVYLGTPDALAAWGAMSEDQRREREAAGMKAWGDWVDAHRAAIVATGSPLGKTKRVFRDGIGDIRNALTAYTVVQAESHEAAARLFEGHPHFTIFPGDSVEVMECLPLPQA